MALSNVDAITNTIDREIRSLGIEEAIDVLDEVLAQCESRIDALKEDQEQTD